MAAQRIDFELSGGTVYLFRPLTRVAHAWVEEHLPADATWCSAVAVEHRYIGPIIGGAIGEGLVVQSACGPR